VARDPPRLKKGLRTLADSNLKPRKVGVGSCVGRPTTDPVSTEMLSNHGVIMSP